MVEQSLFYLNKRLRPAEGWLVFILLGMAVLTLATAVLEVKWVPEAQVVMPTAVFGLLLGVVLAKRPVHTIWAWLLILLYAIFFTILSLAQLIPPLSTLNQGGEALRQFWLQNGAIFYDRMASWFVAVFSDGSSQETIVFAFGLGILSFLLAAFAGWTTFRRQRPLPGLMLLGLALAVNSYFGAVQIWWTGFFVGIAALLTAVVNYARLEKEWTSDHIDYPEDTRLELAAYSATIAAGLLALALVLPSFSINRMQAWFASLTPVAEAESSLGQAFGGVNVPREKAAENPGAVGGTGVLPRHYLLDGSPELLSTVMMTAVVSVEVGQESLIAPPELLRGSHWRSLSYDVYTGEGWAISEERIDPVDAFERLLPTAITKQITLTQQVNWQRDNRVIRYSTGLPVQFDQPTVVSYRGLEDVARVRGEGNHYQVRSTIPNATSDELRLTTLENVPPAILARYTTLPDSVPGRVHNLAEEIAGDLDNPYDQARAIEKFLRQYPYSLDVPLPTKQVDAVDYFLFDLQTGYCDYYASSMVVLARSLGLPARLGVGFLAQTPDENGLQTIIQKNGHSWAEIYFADYGWIEFEPTPAFPSPRENSAVAFVPDVDRFIYQPLGLDTTLPPPIPAQAPLRPFPWGRLLIVGFVGFVLFIFWRRGRQDRALRADGVVWAYDRLQQSASKLGQPAQANQTPTEFSQSLLSQVNGRQPAKTSQTEETSVPEAVQKIIHLYEERRYAGRESGGHDEAKRAWKQLKRPLWRLRLARLFSRKSS